MSTPPTTPAAAWADEVALCRVRARLLRAIEPPWLHAEVARRMAQRVALFKQPPRQVLDWGSRIGGAGDALRAACPQARILAVEAAAPAPASATARRWWLPGRRRSEGAEAIGEAAVEAGMAQLLWSNMGLHLEPEPQAVMARWHRALAVDGLLMFSTFGPGTLAELRALYTRCGWPRPHAPFVDMHDLGDMLVAAGFADPVMDQETLTLTWAGADALLAELRGLGGNADRSRFAGLRTPRWRARLLAELQGMAAGRPALSFEIVYGHAVRPVTRVPMQASTTIALDEMRALVSARRRGRGGGDESLR